MMMCHCAYADAALAGCSGRLLWQAALERQDLSSMYLAHHELERVLIIMNNY